ncbi:YjcZ family sporulation protein [Radiobacillus kanasensis]|nr:YjcZ family sporulation protein [Radiobacillus kanasensis]UFT99031.1 YjcZ family sporulation protein [Radiobacillus kanasensis]
MSYGVFGDNNGFVLLVVIFVLLVIVGSNYPIAGYGWGY